MSSRSITSEQSVSGPRTSALFWISLFNKRLAALLSVAASLVVFGWFWSALSREFPRIWRENGPMELCQVLCLAAGVLVLLWTAKRVRSSVETIFYCSLAALFLHMAILEFDVRSFDHPPPWLLYLLRGTFRNVNLALLWFGMAVLAVRDLPGVWRVFQRWLPTTGGMLMIAAGLFWGLGAMADKAVLLKKDFFYEELFEANAASLMLMAACFGFFSRNAESPFGVERPASLVCGWPLASSGEPAECAHDCAGMP